MNNCNQLFTDFSKEYNLFCRYLHDTKSISDLDIILTKIYLLFMTIMPIYIIIYKIDHYKEDVNYCETHKNVHSCRNITFPGCLLEIVINIFTLKLLMQSFLGKITNTYRFFYKNSNRVIDYIEEEINDKNTPNNITKIEVIELNND